MSENALHLVLRKHYWKLCGPLRRDDVIEPRQLRVEHFLIEEQDRASCLVLCGRGNATFVGEARKKTLHLDYAAARRMPHCRTARSA